MIREPAGAMTGRLEILEQGGHGSVEVLGNLVIPNRDGRFVKLQEVAVRVDTGPSNIYH